MSVQIILPECSEDSVSEALRSLTQAIVDKAKKEQAMGLLGGEYGYGAEYENDEFMMHPYCWCESEDCKWCSEDACGCPHPMPEEYWDDELISSITEANRLANVPPIPFRAAKYGTKEYKEASAAFDKAIAYRNKHLSTVWPERKHTCKPAGLMADRERGDTWLPPQSAPNFWHKPSGFRVWWYKYIGRGMEMDGQPPPDVFVKCIDSINPLNAHTEDR